MIYDENALILIVKHKSPKQSHWRALNPFMAGQKDLLPAKIINRKLLEAFANNDF